MALFNWSTKEVTLKIVYYGPGLSGKTTNLQYLHSVIDPKKRGKLLALATEGDRTLFFDFMPVKLGKIKNFTIRFQLYTVPGQVRFNATRRLVLKGADAVVFVADSQRSMLKENIQSLENMRENLKANDIDPDDIPIVMQYNKRDLPDILSVEELNKALNQKGYPYFEAVAFEGTGVNETFQEITKLLLKHISKKHKLEIATMEEKDIKKPVKEEITFSEVESTPTVEPVVKEEVIEQPIEQPKLPETKVPTFDIHQEIFQIKDSIDRLINLIDNKKDIKESVIQIKVSIEKLQTSVEENNQKQEEMLQILREIKNSIDNAKIRKRWFLFG